MRTKTQRQPTRLACQPGASEVGGKGDQYDRGEGQKAPKCPGLFFFLSSQHSQRLSPRNREREGKQEKWGTRLGNGRAFQKEYGLSVVGSVIRTCPANGRELSIQY